MGTRGVLTALALIAGVALIETRVAQRPSAGALPASRPRSATTAPGRPGWQLVWSDEFDRDGLPDPTGWNLEGGFAQNQEKQYYTRGRRENARIERGVLVIEGRKERYPYTRPGRGDRPRQTGYARYTSARLTTEGKAAWTYGRFEARARLPRGKGVWPAFWTLGTSIRTIGWPRCGEIDIMEFVGKEPDKVHATVHFGPDGRHRSKGGKLPVAKPWEDFHVYAAEWWPDRIDFFCDDRKYFTYTIPPGDRGAAFRRPHYLLLNLALGGTWGGPIDDRILPQQFRIDYVRVYRHRSMPPAAPPPPRRGRR